MRVHGNSGGDFGFGAAHVAVGLLTAVVSLAACAPDAGSADAEGISSAVTRWSSNGSASMMVSLSASEPSAKFTLRCDPSGSESTACLTLLLWDVADATKQAARALPEQARSEGRPGTVQRLATLTIENCGSDDRGCSGTSDIGWEHSDGTTPVFAKTRIVDLSARAYSVRVSRDAQLPSGSFDPLQFELVALKGQCSPTNRDQPACADLPATLRGRVYRDVSDDPGRGALLVAVANERIDLVNRNGSPLSAPIFEYTDSYGYYELPGALRGEYSLSIENGLHPIVVSESVFQNMDDIVL